MARLIVVSFMMLFVGLFSADTCIAAVEASTWGQIKAQDPEETSAGKMVRTVGPISCKAERVRVSAVSHGSLSVTLTPDSPSDQILIMGQTDAIVAKFNLSASVDEDIRVSKVSIPTIRFNDGPFGTFLFSQYHLYSGTTRLASVFRAVVVNFTQEYVEFTGLNIIVPKNGNVTLTLKVDLRPGGPGIDVCSVGSTTAYSLRPGSVQAVGVQSNAVSKVRIGQDGSGIVSGAVTIYATKISVAWASDTPSGAASQQVDQVIMKVVVANSANAGNYSATITDFVANVSLSDFEFTREAKKIRVYKDAISSVNLVGEGDWRWGYYATRIRLRDEGVGVAAGATRTFIFTMDTSTLVKSGGLEYLAPSISSLYWTDAISGELLNDVVGLPLMSKYITY